MLAKVAMDGVAVIFEANTPVNFGKSGIEVGQGNAQRSIGIIELLELEQARNE